MRGLLAALRPKEAATLQRVAHGMADPIGMEWHYLARLKALELIEYEGRRFRLTALGRRRLEMLRENSEQA
jgi:hypothetical protein